MSFTQQDLGEMSWSIIEKITFLKNEIIIKFRSRNRLTASEKITLLKNEIIIKVQSDNKTYLQFYKEAKKRLKEDQIDLGDVE